MYLNSPVLTALYRWGLGCALPEIQLWTIGFLGLDGE